MDLTRLEIRLLELRKEVPAELQVTVCDWLSLGDIIDGLNARSIPHTVEAPIVYRFYSSNSGRQDVDASEGVIRFELDGDPVRCEGIYSQSESIGVLLTHRESILSLLKAAEEASDNPYDGKIYQMDGDWKSPKALQDSLNGYSWDEVFLPRALEKPIREAAKTFFESAELYQESGLRHRRGILLSGPPGSGKTSIVRAMVAESNVGFVLVTSVIGRKEPSPTQLRRAFEKAAKIAPSIICLEDVDGLLESFTRNELLAQLDGLAKGGEGVLVVATTNHPDKLDTALTERPSRFDDKWVLKHPDAQDREAYLLWRFGKAGMEVGAEELNPILRLTSGMSFAMLQDIVTRTLVLNRRESQELATAIRSAAEAVRLQITQSKNLDGEGSVGFRRED